MSFSPGTGTSEIHSPDIFMPDICCNLDSQFLNARESIKEESMCVYARVRPILPQEKANDFKEECIFAVDDKTVRIVVAVTSTRHKTSRQSEKIVEDYFFNAAFGRDIGQFVFFQETMLTSMQNFLEGQNSLIFTYGITGSGKTHTLQGTPENPGIIPLSLRLYFAAVEKQLLQEIRVKPHMYDNIIVLSAAEQKAEYYAKKELLSLYNEECDIAPGSFRNSNSKTFAMTLCDLFSDSYVAEERQTTLGPEDMASAQAATVMKEVIRNSAENQQGVCSVWVSFVEIYNENIYDLLQPFTNQRKRLMLGEDRSGNVYIKGAREICVYNGDEALKILNIGRKQLSIASTKMNYQSSRSHCIYTIRVVRVRDINDLSYGKVSRLCFCDLAGSERAQKTGTTGVRLKEAGAINTSLLVLGRCLEQLRMNQMGKDKRMIPFRDSKLTRIFSGFFMGQGKAVMIANASPCDYTFDETWHVLKFSALAKKLLINNTFYADASSTLHNICTQWSNTSNTSFNESMESVDSDSDIIKKKDEIIEKLIQLAERLTKKEQETADVEMRIRQEVCQEYSQYSDQLIEAKRIMYEDLIEDTKEKYKKLLAAKEKMYEDILEGFKHQLNETVDSGDDTNNDSNSHMDLEDSVRSSPGKRLNLEQDAGESKEAVESQITEAIVLQSTLASITAELEEKKQELLESQKSVTNLDIDNGKLKNVVEALKEQIRNLEKKLLSNERSYNEQLQVTFRTASKVERENEEIKIKAAALEEEINSLKAARDDYDVDNKNLITKINILEDKLLSSEKNHAEATEQLQSIDILKDEIEQLESQVKELKDSKVQYEENIVNYKTNIDIMKDKLFSVNEDYDRTREELQNHFNISSELEKEFKNKIARLEEENRELKEFHTECKTADEKYKISFKTLEDRVQSMQAELDTANNQMEVDSAYISELKKEFKNKIARLEEENKELNELHTECETADEKYQISFKILEDRIQSIQVELDTANNQMEVDSAYISELKKGIDMYKQEIETLKQKIEVLLPTSRELEVTKVDNMQMSAKCNELQGYIDMYKQEIETLKQKVSENFELEKKLSSGSQELKTAEDCIQEKNSKLEELERRNSALELEIQQLRKDQEANILGSKEQLHLAEVELETIKKDCEYKTSKLECQNDAYKSELQQLKTQQETEKMELTEKFLLANKELKVVNDEMHQKSSKLSELENLNKTWKLEEEKLKQDKKNLTSERENLKKKLILTETELETMKNDFQQESEKHQAALNQIDVYKVQIEKLKEEMKLKIEKMGENSFDMSKDHTTAEKLSELEKENDAYKSELQQLKTQQETEKMELTEKFLLANKELRAVNDEMHQKSSKLSELENLNKTCKLEVEKLNQDKKDLISEQENLKEKLILTGTELETMKNDVQQISQKHLAVTNQIDVYKVQIEKLISEKIKIEEEMKLKIEKMGENSFDMSKDHTTTEKLSELEKENDAYKSELQQLKTQQETEKMELTEKFLLANKELRAVNDEMHQKSSKLLELENLNKTCKLEVERLKQDKEDLICERDNLKKKLILTETELETMKNDVQQISQKHLAVVNQMSLCELDIKKMKEDKKINEEEKQDLMIIISANEEKLEDFEEKLLELNEELKTSKDCISVKNLLVEDLQNRLEQFYVLLELLGKCEARATDNIKNLITAADKYKSDIMDLHHQIRSREYSIEELEKALCESQEQLKDVQVSCKHNLASEKEQHEIEIKQTMKLKHLVEEENMNLKKHDSRLKSNDKKIGAKRENPPKGKKDVNSKGKENLPKAPSTRSLRKKEIDYTELSFNSVHASTPAVNKQKSRKRVSDDDFKPDAERASKKMKPAESKIPVQRTSRRKIQSNNVETLSPVQKIANSFASKIKVISNNISTHISSPRLTRGRKKLFNPEAPSSSRSEKATKGKK